MFRTALVLAIVVGAVIVTISTDSAREPDLAGVYVCTGTHPDGSPYEGLVEIVKEKDAFQLVWVAESEVIAIGMGIRAGNVLAVAYYSGLLGVAAYRIEGGNRLVGEWTIAGSDGALFPETLTKVPPEELEPSVPLEGPAPLPARPEPSPRIPIDPIVLETLTPALIARG